jgi:hypothetical protein
MPCSQATFMGQIDSCVCPILHTLRLMPEILSSITTSTLTRIQGVIQPVQWIRDSALTAQAMRAKKYHLVVRLP